MIAERRLYKDFDGVLVATAFLIFLIGLLTIYSATQIHALQFSESYVLRQLAWFVVGVLLLVIVLMVSYQKFIDVAYVLYGINILLLVLVLIFGRTRLGAQRWFSLGGFTFQPSEFIKINLILVLANFIGARRDEMVRFKNFLGSSFLLLISFVLVMLQPDLGTALLLVPIFLSALLVGGARPRYLVGIIGLGIASFPFFWHLLREYQKQRLLVFVNPNIDPLGAGYTIIQSKIAMGSGGLFGKGWLNGTQNQLNFLPERHTDFIFSVIGEEWGFLGTIAMIVLYFIIVKRALNIAALTTDIYGKVIAAGIAVMIGLQVIINIGMTIGLMPVVGIPLPLVSYGGSSLVSTLIAIGLLMNVSMRRSTF